ncbi:MAG: non-ribosomal peptide synthetase, partial [Symploca sp. SIO1C4]|nr:non-ribosomal peptide synthetase [Symploca sp. SIO1C4]
SLVLLKEYIPGDRRLLVAYVLPKKGESLRVGELRSFLKQKLPDYMVPSFFVLLDALPLTLNGKVDHRALLALDLSQPDLQETFVAPRTSVEKQIADIWSQFLKLEKVGIHNNFFELGGDSLIATQIISRLNNAFNIKLPLSVLFELSTIAQLNKTIETNLWTAQYISNSASKTTYKGNLKQFRFPESIPLSFAQQRLWFLNQLENNNSAYNIPYGYRLTGNLSIKALAQSLNEIIRRHEILRTTFASAEIEPKQVISSNIQITLTIIDLQELSTEEKQIKVQQITTEEAQQTFELTSGFLFRAKLLRLSVQEHILLLNLHHIVSDGWSFDIFFRELTELYTAFSTNQPSPLSELPIQYADFAHWQREWLQGEVLESQLNYWKQQLSGSLPILQLPTDYPHPRVQTYKGAYNP